MFWGLRCVLVGFLLVIMLKNINCVVDLWLLSFSFVFGFDPVPVWGVFDVFWGLRCVLVGFFLVVMVKNCKL